MLSGLGGPTGGGRRWAVVAALVAAGLALAAWGFLSGGGNAGAVQPIAFNHRAHVKLAGCILCHRFYESREVAGRPEASRCMLCHAYSVTDKPEAETLRRLAEENQPIPWVRLTRLQPFVRFSHQRHVVVGKVECSACHGAIAQTTEPPRRPLVDITMQFCLDCHLARGMRLSPEGVEALRETPLNPKVVAALEGLGRQRFSSDEELLATLAREMGTTPGGDDQTVILAQLHSAPPVTRDCFACHR